MDISYNVGDFSGPLDLLLGLIAKNKIDIFDIPISLILEQYYECIDRMKEEKYEVTADFLAMASELVLIKSKMMLPAAENEEEEDPRERLVRMLIEYRRYKEVLPQFAKVSDGWVNSYTKSPEPPPSTVTYTLTHELDELSEAYLRMYVAQGRKAPPPPDSFKGIVGKEPVSVFSRVISVMKKLYKNTRMRFADLFSGAKSRSEVVATFLAVLELSKGGSVRVEGMGNDASVELARDRKRKRFNSDGNGE